MSIWGNIGGFFMELFKGIFSDPQIKVITEDLEHFVQTDVGAIAVDAVEYVSATLPQADGVTKRGAAVAKLKADLKTAGKDIEGLGESTLNWFIETALQAVLAKVTLIATA